MTFNPEITVSTIVSVVTMIFVAGGFYAMTKSLYTQVADIKEDLKALNKVVMDVAVQNTRIDNLEKRTDLEIAHLKEDIRDLKHLKGFIKDPV